MKQNKMGRILLAGGLFCLLLGLATWVLRPRLFISNESFYRLKDNTADVMFFGSSNAYTNVNPAQLYDEHGIAADILAGSGQNIWNSYYYLEEAYKTQSPQVVVLEIYNSYRTYEYDELPNAITNTLGIRSPLTRFAAIKASVPPQQVVDLMLGWPVYHSRYREIGKDIGAFFDADDSNGAIVLGQYPVFLSYNFDSPKKDDNILPIPLKTKEYIEKFVALAKSHGSKVILIKTPCVLPLEATGVFNAVGEQFKNDPDVSFLNLNDYAEQMGFNYATDLQDIVHCNMMGNRKITAFLGNWLSQNISLPDRRGSEGWQQWADYTVLWKRTGFIYPEDMTFGASQFPEQTSFSPTADSQVFSKQVDVKNGKWYLFTGTTTAQKDGYLVVDLFAQGDFNVARYTHVIEIKAGTQPMVVAFHLIDKPPEGLLARIISTDGALLTVADIHFAQQNN